MKTESLTSRSPANYAAEKHFSPATIERWLRHSDEGQGALLDLADTLRLGENQFRDFLDLLEDIAARRGSTVLEIFADNMVVELRARRLSRNEHIKAFREVLRRMRFPQLVDAETGIATHVRSMQLPGGTNLAWPRDLEGSQLTLTITASSARELREKLRSATTALDGVELEEVFRLLDGGE